MHYNKSNGVTHTCLILFTVDQEYSTHSSVELCRDTTKRYFFNNGIPLQIMTGTALMMISHAAYSHYKHTICNLNSRSSIVINLVLYLSKESMVYMNAISIIIILYRLTKSGSISDQQQLLGLKVSSCIHN